MSRFYVYIIKSRNGKHYIGQTNNLTDRINRHNENRNKYTKGKGPWELVISHKVTNRTSAVQIEKHLKKLKSPKKAIEYLSKLSGNDLVWSIPTKSGGSAVLPKGLRRRRSFGTLEESVSAHR